MLDRGILDLFVYVEDFETGNRILKELELEYINLLENRYDKVFFLESDKSIFNKSKFNNPARNEQNYNQVKILSEKVKEIWEKHSKYIPIKTQEDFSDKVYEIFNKILN